MDTSVQNFLIFEAILQVSRDGKSLVITNKKPIDNPEYILEADPVEVQR